MNPNQPFTPQPLSHELPTQQIQPVVPVIKKNNAVSKIIIGSLIAVLIAIGVGAYLWRDTVATRQKNDDAAKIIQLESEIANLNKKVDQLSVTSGVSESFSSITARSNTTKAQTNAASVLKIAEVVNANGDHYPILTSDFLTPNAVLPKGITVTAGALNAGNGLTAVRWEYTGSASAPTGGRVSYWDFTTNEVAIPSYYAGVATTSSTFVTPAS